MNNTNDKYEKGDGNVQQNDDATKDCPCKGQNPIWPGNPSIPKPGTETEGPKEGEKTCVPVVR